MFRQGIQCILLWHILRFRIRLLYFSNKSRNMKSNLIEWEYQIKNKLVRMEFRPLIGDWGMKCCQWSVGTRTCLDSGQVGESGPARTENAKSHGNQDPLMVLFKAPLVVGVCLPMLYLNFVWESESEHTTLVCPFIYCFGDLACNLLTWISVLSVHAWQ